MTIEQKGRIVRAFFDRKQLLKVFWSLANQNPSPEDRLELLQYYSNLTVKKKNSCWPIIMRKQFNTIKGHIYSMKKKRKCFVCRGKARIRHHILLISLYGTNSRKNLVTLCDPCHWEVHPFMKKWQAEKADSLGDFIKELDSQSNQ